MATSSIAVTAIWPSPGKPWRGFVPNGPTRGHRALRLRHQQRIDQRAGRGRRQWLDAEHVAIEQAAVERVVEIWRRSLRRDAAILLAFGDHRDDRRSPKLQVAFIE